MYIGVQYKTSYILAIKKTYNTNTFSSNPIVCTNIWAADQYEWNNDDLKFKLKKRM